LPSLHTGTDAPAAKRLKAPEVFPLGTYDEMVGQVNDPLKTVLMEYMMNGNAVVGACVAQWCVPCVV
jgi:hypothetical protein